jgi:hypothetical protein
MAGRTITVELGTPSVEEITRIIDAWFDTQPLSTAYEVFEGDDGGIGELPVREQRLMQDTAMRYWWLSAARKRAAKP